MKSLIIIATLLGSMSSFAKSIQDSTCEIAIPEASNFFWSWSINDTALNGLIEKGYTPYRGGEPTQGLYLSWGFEECEDHWYGQRCLTRASLKKRLSNGEMAILYADKATGSRLKIADILSGFPDCHVQ